MSQQKDDNAEDCEQSGPEATNICGESQISANPHRVDRPIPPFDPASFSKYAWYEIDESSLPLLATLDPASRCAYAKLGHLPGPMRYELGSFRIDEHRTVSFEAIPAFGEASYSEIAEYPPGSASPPDNIDEGKSPSPLMRFLRLTDKNVPVPMVLLEFDDESDDPEVERALAGRDVVDSMDNFGKKADAFVTPQATSASAVWTCFNGGDDVFSNAYCQSTGIWHCDSGAWSNITRTSGHKRRRVSHSRVAACGHSDTTVVHQRRYWDWGWKWVSVAYPYGPWGEQKVPPGGVKYWKHVHSGVKRRARIKCFIQSPSASDYFRAWTAFYN
jgi:hypothetical protein